MRRWIVAAIASFLATGALADGIVKVKSASDVQTTMDALEGAVSGAGATIFARVDHTGGAKKVGLDLHDAQLLIFGNPKLGTPAMQDDAVAGLFLPMKVLVYQDTDGNVWLTYEDPAHMLGGLNIAADAGYVTTMTGALGKFTNKAAGN